MNKTIFITLLTILIKSVVATDLVNVENFYENCWRKLKITDEDKTSKFSTEYNQSYLLRNSTEINNNNDYNYTLKYWGETREELYISEYLIDTIKNYQNNTMRLQNIIDKTSFICETQGENKNSWYKEYEYGKLTGHVFLGECNNLTEEEITALEVPDRRILQNNPQVLQDILNCRELLRFKEVLKNTNIAIAPHDDFETNDVLRALSLSGIFCNLEGNLFSPYFSGMLVPGQTQNSKTYKIHSCLHGFIDLQIKNMYFIPYGIALNKNNAANHEEAFQVKSLYRRSVLIDQMQLNEKSWDSAYKEEDYIQVEIKGTNEGENTLCKVLKNRQNSNIFNNNNLFPSFMEETDDLPNLLGNEEKYNELFKSNKLGNNANLVKQYIVIGRPANPKYQLNDSGFTVVTNLTNNTFADPLRSLENDRDVKNPPNIGSTNQIASNFPNYYGMSGGIVLEILTDKESNHDVFARPIGTVWGVERMFKKNETGNYEFISLNSFINKIA